MQTEAETASISRAIQKNAAGLSFPQRLLMLLFNYFPLAHALATALVVVIDWAPLRWRCVAGLFLLYILPPVAARVLRFLVPIREGYIRFGSREFFSWWALFNFQVLFCRLPALEELLRLVPGLYSLWLRMWGARIGRLTYWAAGFRILDRSFVRIGNDVIFGAAVRINPHVMARNEQGQPELILASVKIGDRALVGGYSLLTAGTEIAADESTRAFLVSPPFSKWKGGTRVSKNGP